MDAPVNQQSPITRNSCYGRLDTFLHATGSRLSRAQALDLAVDAWLAAQRAKAEPAPPAPQESRGYQWKCLFLPHDTELRMRHEGVSFFARVVGNDIVFRGGSVSPRGMTLAIAGAGRNAWRDLWVRLPGETKWQCALLRRKAIRQEEVVLAQSPADTMAAAAASMSAALKTVLQLVDGVKKRIFDQPERRIDRRRRETDGMDDCMPFDGRGPGWSGSEPEQWPGVDDATR